MCHVIGRRSRKLLSRSGFHAQPPSGEGIREGDEFDAHSVIMQQEVGLCRELWPEISIVAKSFLFTLFFQYHQRVPGIHSLQ